MTTTTKPVDLRDGDLVLIDGRYRRIDHDALEFPDGRFYVSSSKGNGRRVWSETFQPDELAQVKR